MKKINSILRKCKTLSRQLGHPSSYAPTFIRSKSSPSHSQGGANCNYQHLWAAADEPQEIKDGVELDPCETIFVGSSRRRYVISSKYLTHPLLTALIEKSKPDHPGLDPDPDLSVKCEVVLFDHLLWMMENADPNLGSDSLEELAELYYVY